ncbi:MAG TPA: aromatic amino acid transport family protein [Candidatus Magasanikbacteria bacterium]|nr:aromatic amino acid transport family protein [Candidatus Magasanikbacteria bacterium]
MSLRNTISDELVHFRGLFQRRIGLWQGVALIVSGTIGAGVLGLPYAISRAGAIIGFLYIVFLGLVMMVLNLMLGQLVSVQPKPLQLSGLARKYLGKWGGYMMTTILYTMLSGVLLVYLIGEGETLAALFGGESVYWTMGFFLLGVVLISSGMRMVKRVESVLVVGVLAVVFMIILVSFPHVQTTNLISYNFSELLFPYGVVLFAFHSTMSMPEAYSILKHKNGTYKLSIIYAGIIAILVYAAFALLSIGVMGPSTPEIATTGLDHFVGHKAFVFGNVFAILAMGMSFLISSLSFRDSLVWDHGIREWKATIIVCLIPFLLFYCGVRSFVAVIDIVGGVLVSFELFLIILMYWNAHRRGEFIEKRTFSFHQLGLLIIPVLLALAIGAVYSVSKLF